MAAACGRALEDFNPLRKAEQKLKAAAQRGEVCRLGGRVPRNPTPDVIVRASLLRFLVLGGDAKNPVHEKGVRIKGGRVTGDLDLSACSGCRPLCLEHCFLEGVVTFDRATTRTVTLNGSQVQKLTAEGAQIKGDLALERFRSYNPVDISTARVDGDFKAAGARFCGGRDQMERPEALVLDGTIVSGNLELPNAICAGAVRMNAVEVKSDLDLTGVNIIGGRVDNLFPKQSDDIPVAITLHRSNIAGRLFLLELGSVCGQVRLLYTHCGAFVADKSILSHVDFLLDGFTYDRLWDVELPRQRHTLPVKIRDRIKWLSETTKNTASAQFNPQPASQLAKVLADMGFEEDAKKVAIKREVWRRKRGHWRWYNRAFHFLYGALTQYGYRPDWIIRYLFVLLIASAVVYHFAKAEHGLIPADEKKNPTAFNAGLYALDNGLPFFNFGLSKDWRPNLLDIQQPMAGRPTPGKLFGIHAGEVVRITIIVQTVFGWIGGIAVLAFLQGLARRDK